MLNFSEERHILHEQTTVSRVVEHASENSSAVENVSLGKRWLRYFKGLSRKPLPVLLQKGHVYGSDDKTTGFGIQCNMTKYLSRNTQICNAVINYKNTSMFNTKIGYNLVLKRQYFERFERDLRTGNTKPREDNCNIDNVLEDCDTLRKSYLYGKDVTEEEKLFPLAFAMKIHTGANQAHRLLRYIYRGHNSYCIHVDKKSPAEIYNKFKRIESCFDNIKVIDDRVNVVYSTIRQVEAELKCMDEMNKTKVAWKYYINLAGQEFILKTNIEIVKILKLLNGTNDIESYPIPHDEYHKFQQKIMVLNTLPITTKVKKEPFRQNVSIHKGSAYGMFSRKFVNFILNDTFVKEFLIWLRDIYSPEELIWATLQALPGTPGFRRTVTTERDPEYISRTVKWKTDTTATCYGKYVRWICIYGLGDVPGLLSRINMVANKFYEDYQPLTLDCLEKKMYERLLNGGLSKDFNLDIYRQIKHLE